MYKVYTAQFQEGAELGLAIRGLMRQLGLTLKENRKIIHSNWHSLGVEGLKVISLWEGGPLGKPCMQNHQELEQWRRVSCELGGGGGGTGASCLSSGAEM